MKTDEVIAELMVKDVEKTIRFYKDVLDFKLLPLEEEEGPHLTPCGTKQFS